MDAWAAERCADKVVLIAGCGGGCDVFGGMIFGHQLRGVAKKVVYANLSFTTVSALRKLGKDVVTRSKGADCFAVAPGVEVAAGAYFPEARMATFTGSVVYAIPKQQTVLNLRKAYEAIFEAEGGAPDVLVLIDGGSDVLMTGVESGLATPVEDMMNLKAVLPLPVPLKVVQAIGTTVDVAHGIVEGELDARLEQLRASGALLWAEPLTDKHPSAGYYIEGVAACDPATTIVQSLACAAMQGHRGLYTPAHLVARIGASKVPLSEQTATLFCFDLEAVAREVVYLDRVKDETNIYTMMGMLADFRHSIGKR